ncbi:MULTISPECIES: DUF1656 domain-containing protein [Microbulbifer]|uniref:DUF1656 domain-containing protein n=1 Tax=Microbulbifer salipaludis TaxID=187980 RepID=A0ABS3E4R0_9GAMM|nr:MULTISPECIES: DUF1656 domain-containing protein [Microbulbifer]MBN8430295.1 DUF1656 domain-containing protein [Microbulbifer salipaludis]
MPVPHELAIAGIYLSPMLVAATLGLILALTVAHLLDRYRLSRYFAHPALVLTSLSVIFTLLVGTLFIGI